jgi:hypothetical protein
MSVRELKMSSRMPCHAVCQIIINISDEFAFIFRPHYPEDRDNMLLSNVCNDLPDSTAPHLRISL